MTTVNVAVVAFAETVTETGRVSERLLLDSPTASPPTGAAPVSVTVHVDDVIPIREALAHETVFTVGATPVPVTANVAVAFVEEVLPMLSWPATAPAAVGSNFTVSAAVWPGLRVSGSVTPEML